MTCFDLVHIFWIRTCVVVNVVQSIVVDIQCDQRCNSTSLHIINGDRACVGDATPGPKGWRSEPVWPSG